MISELEELADRLLRHAHRTTQFRRSLGPKVLHISPGLERIVGSLCVEILVVRMQEARLPNRNLFSCTSAASIPTNAGCELSLLTIPERMLLQPPVNAHLHAAARNAGEAAKRQQKVRQSSPAKLNGEEPIMMGPVGGIDKVKVHVDGGHVLAAAEDGRQCDHLSLQAGDHGLCLDGSFLRAFAAENLSVGVAVAFEYDFDVQGSRLQDR